MVVMTCTSCGSLNQVDLLAVVREEGKTPSAKCHSCDHEAPLPDEKRCKAIERQQARQRRQIIVGSVCFLLAIALWLARGWLMEHDPANEFLKTGLMIVPSVLVIWALVETVVHEAGRQVCEF